VFTEIKNRWRRVYQLEITLVAQDKSDKKHNQIETTEEGLDNDISAFPRKVTISLYSSILILLLIISLVVYVFFKVTPSTQTDDVQSQAQVNFVHHIQSQAEQGVVEYQNKLGLMYFNGIGVTQDNNEALKWWKRAAKQGHVKTQIDLAQIYDNGIFIPEDHAEALKWWEQAAKQGSDKAQFNLASEYAMGEVMMTDYEKAYAWYSASAIQGNHSASKGRDMIAEQLTSDALAEAHKLSYEYYEKYVEPFQ